MSSDRLLLPVLLLLSACCVKENRESCPCILTLDLSALPVTPVILSVMRPDYGITKVVHTDTLFTFSVPKGVVYGIVGENGAGKSTFIKVITGAHQPDGGEIILNGEKVVMSDPIIAQERGIAAIYQHAASYPDLSVAENIFSDA